MVTTPRSQCPFCNLEPGRVFYESDLVIGLRDGFPVSPGHVLLVPRRHVATWFELSREEHLAILDSIEAAREAILQGAKIPDGFNIGVNIGEASGQTIAHAHVHLIPRYSGDVPDPRGGVRHVIPHLANYLSPQLANAEKLEIRDGDLRRSVFEPPRIVGSDNKPLYEALTRDLATASKLDLAVAFILRSGLIPLRPHLEDLIDRRGSIRILTGDYLDATEPEALTMLLDLQELAPDQVRLRVFETGHGLSFHPKAYLISGDRPGSTAYIGSSNISRTALFSSIEWNYRFSERREPEALGAIADEFSVLFNHPRTTELTIEWIARYASRRRMFASYPEPPSVHPEADAPPLPAQPHRIQIEALDALKASRRLGHRAGLVVLATGLGKTWLSAFDSVPFERVLFVAHREEILRQSLENFRRIRPEAKLGYFAGEEKNRNADVLFASIMTLGKPQHLKSFEPNHFSYIVVDEFHHAHATTYRRLIDYFEPEFLLGLTATPERSDGADLLSLCGENLVYSCNLVDGINENLLTPFHYFGVPDVVDYRNIPWRSGRFDADRLESDLATVLRASNAFEQWQKRKGKRTLAFCVSQRHANYMCSYFQSHGVRTVAVHSGPDSAPRASSLEALETGELDVVFAVDMFNEGVDVPSIDTILMLRPTESRILWLQQFGRGLRKAEDKPFLTVVDYIGNHRCFLNAAMALLPGADDSFGGLSLALARLADRSLQLPSGCEVQYELEALNILNALAAPSVPAQALLAWYRNFIDQQGARPSANEAWHAGHDLGAVRRQFGSWFGFVSAQGGLDDEQSSAFVENKGFFKALETTQMNKSYKMLLLLAMIGDEKFPGSASIADLVSSFRNRARRSPYLERDVGDALDGDDQLRRLLVQNPIDAWIQGRGTGGVRYFTFDGQSFSSRLNDTDYNRQALAFLTTEICEWRLAQYLARAHDESHQAPLFRCRVSHSSGRPILFLPDRTTIPGIPKGWTDVLVNGVRYSANFVKIAINVMRLPSETRNQLPEILRRWFGDNAGSPGSNDYVLFRLENDVYWMEPVGVLQGPM
jgi:superfamily II DNA or RNA helicase/diadenosine tetraphosphate (Ap4A) HIT family hydrolase